MTPMTSAPPATPTTTPAPVRFLTAFISQRTWREFGYQWLMFLLTPFAIAYLLSFFMLSAGLVWTVVGLYLPGVILLGARGWGSMYRGLADAVVGFRVRPPARYVRPRGFWRGLGALFVDGDAWRALLFMAITFPLALVAAYVNTMLLLLGLGAVTYPLWRSFIPAQQAADGSWHRGSQLGTDYFIDTPPRIALAMLVGLAVLLAWPWVLRGFTLVFQLLTSALLGPTRTGERVAALRATRAAAVKDADARLRRIERDLHDGTQARLVAVAMQLGEARAHLATGTQVEQASALVDSAHASTKEALTELREIVRGIHPPALDAGLAVAIETLAARAPLPVGVHVDGELEATGPLGPALQSLIYYSVAELLANVAKHAGANVADIEVEVEGGTLHVRVSDDGQGGAEVVAPDGSGLRTGLAGLAERVAAVDGTLAVSSPVGGPTVVTVTVPIATSA